MAILLQHQYKYSDESSLCFHLVQKSATVIIKHICNCLAILALQLSTVFHLVSQSYWWNFTIWLGVTTETLKCGQVCTQGSDKTPPTPGLQRGEKQDYSGILNVKGLKTIRHEQEPLFAIWDGNGKSGVAFPHNGTGTGKHKQFSLSLGW